MNKNLKAFGRIDAQGRLVAGSIVYRLKQPTGDYIQLQDDQCCNFDKSLTYNYILPSSSLTGIKLLIYCNETLVFTGVTSQNSTDDESLLTVLNDTYSMLGNFSITAESVTVLTWSIKESLKKSFCPTGVFSFTLTEA